MNKPQPKLAYIVVCIFLLVTIASAYFEISAVRSEVMRSNIVAYGNILHTTQRALQRWYNEKSLAAQRLLKGKSSFEKQINVLVQLEAINTENKKFLYLHQAVKRSYGKLFSNKKDSRFRIKSGFNSYYFINYSGQTISSLNDSEIGSLNPIANAYPDILAKVYSGKTAFIPFIEIIDDNGVKQRSAFFLTPVEDNKDNIIAVFAAGVSVEETFSDIINLSKLQDIGGVFAFDKSYHRISRSSSEERLLGTPLINDATKPRLDFLVQVNKGQAIEAQNIAELIHLSRYGSKEINSHTLNDSYTSHTGESVLGLWAWDEKLNLGLAFEVSAASVYETLDSIVSRIVTQLLITIVMSLLMVGLIFRLQRNYQYQVQAEHELLEEKVKERTQDLKAAQIELEKQASTDKLTGIANRRMFDLHLEQQISKSRRNNEVLSLLLLDVDGFKLFNDNYGHVAGDECLAKLGRLLKQQGIADRPGDLVARYGGEEFAIILSNASKEHTLTVAETIRAGVLELGIEHKFSPVTDVNVISASIGVSYQLISASTQNNHIIHVADENLYRAKENGRNSVCFID